MVSGDWRSAQILVPTLRVVMPFVTLCVTRSSCEIRRPVTNVALCVDSAIVIKSALVYVP
ncbi:hypothetical protein DXU85_02220 [Pseudomonas savastanoi]|nr:hypothetical protein DXU85_02220 [Pseudomonas savastanoi]